MVEDSPAGRMLADVSGPIALVGGNEFRSPARDLDAWLLERSGSRTVTVLPTAAAHSRPELAIQTARAHFTELGAAVREVMVLDRQDAEDRVMAEDVESASFLYLTGGDPRLLADVLRGSLVWRAILLALERGAVLAGSSAGAMVLCDRMLVPRRSELAEGLGLLEGRLVVPHHNQWRTVPDVRSGVDVIGIDECTGLVLDADGGRVLGAGSVTVYRDGLQVWSRRAPSALDRLA